MIEISIVLLLPLLSLLILLSLKQWWSRRHFPPGPPSLPILGNVWALQIKNNEDILKQLAKKYGNIYTLWLGKQCVVVLSGFKAVKEGLVRYGYEFSDRTISAFFSSQGKGRGIIFANGPIWKKHRQIGNASLRLLGLGNKMIEHQMKDGAQQLVKIFASTKGQPFDPSLPLINSVSNVICAFSFGYQFAHEDKNFLKLVEDIRTVVRISGGVFHLLYETIPWLMKYLPGPHQKALNSAEIILSFARQEIERHKRYQSLHEPQDFIDFYLLQMEKSKDDPNSVCSEENLACCLLELFIAGVETTYVSLMWAVLLLANHPDIQGSIIVNDLRSVLLDPEEWETPEEFNPNHFLDKDGNFQAREAFMPFGAGQRVCLGEKLSRIELFITLTSLLRTFSFQLPEGVKKLNEKPVVCVELSPRPYKICAVPYHTMS